MLECIYISIKPIHEIAECRCIQVSKAYESRPAEREEGKNKENEEGDTEALEKRHAKREGKEEEKRAYKESGP